MTGDDQAGLPPAAPPPTGPPPGPLEPWPETVRWQSVSTDLIWVELLRLAVLIVIVLAGLAVGWAVSGQAAFGVALTGVLLLTALRTVTIARAVRAWGYAEREDDLLVRHGLLVRRLSIVPYSRMQFVDVSAGPLERAFSLATVQLHTAAAATDARVPGLRPAEASRLRDRLTALGRDRAEGL
ncbi:PH domain-containing protein [Salinispora tropica]|uniref:Membrane-flanked domain n=1 Tax=Salinispora tropica (strain ATCC BAA-916 / DSM 44818 / JCM 13857 / NBRC 105044 / CNB-440) TaxID=369723 RepID=A4X9A6_SALTO|nr:PH domain-containing protein [Salinispora tropica]ABP55467.1 membrane-flanked domain [Salinispora tropica CNB-440]